MESDGYSAGFQSAVHSANPGMSTDSSLPQDYEDQMQLGIRIITGSFQAKMNSLDQEMRGLRLTLDEQRANVNALKKKNSTLEVELVESHQRGQQLAEENKELFKTVGSLRKQIGRLEALKNAVMSSIQDDQTTEQELGDINTLMREDYLRSATPLTSSAMYHGEPGGGVGLYNEARGKPLSPGAPMPQAQTAPAPAPAPAAAQEAPDQGKAFFRQARNRLSYEAFNLFLASIKRMNNRQQTHEETLEEARKIFGADNSDLYRDFEGLLNRRGV